MCALVSVDATGQCAAAQLAACGIATRPVRLDAAEAALVGGALDDAALAAAGEAAKDAVSASDDAQASQTYRRDLLATLVRRTVARAAARAAP